MDAAWFREVMRDEIMPAICQQMHWCKTVVVQMGNAKPHFEKPKGVKESNFDYFNRIGAEMRPKITMRRQPSNSPETSIFDLCLFNSWGRRNHELQLHNDARTIYELWESIQATWANYPPEKLERSFQTRKIALQCIIERKGGNRFNIKHISKAKRDKLLPKT